MALTARQITARIPLQSPKWVPKCPFWRQLPLGGSVGRSAPQQPPNSTINSNFLHHKSGAAGVAAPLGVLGIGSVVQTADQLEVVDGSDDFILSGVTQIVELLFALGHVAACSLIVGSPFRDV